MASYFVDCLTVGDDAEPLEIRRRQLMPQFGGSVDQLGQPRTVISTSARILASSTAADATKLQTTTGNH